VFDLAQPYFAGMPHFPTHPPFLFGLTRKHGEVTGPAGHSSAADAIAMGSHVGTHMDALCHFSCGGKLHGGHEVETAQSYSGGMTQLSVDTLSPMVRRGVLLDIAGQLNVASLPAEFEITPEHMETAAQAQAVEIKPTQVKVVERNGDDSHAENGAAHEGNGSPADPGTGPVRNQGDLILIGEF
jgi:kynurenine formamidase